MFISGRSESNVSVYGNGRGSRCRSGKIHKRKNAVKKTEYSGTQGNAEETGCDTMNSYIEIYKGNE